MTQRTHGPDGEAPAADPPLPKPGASADQREATRPADTDAAEDGKADTEIAAGDLADDIADFA